MNDRDLETPEKVPEITKEKVNDPKSDASTSTFYRSQSPRRFTRSNRRLAGGIVLVALCFLAAFGGARLANGSTLTSSSIISSNSTDGNKIITTQEKDITSVVSKVSPSVVSVIATGTVTTPSIYGVDSQSQTSSAGTGIIISNNGYIITNHHVVGNATTVKVVLADGTTYKDVKVVGSDPLNDIAFLKISGVSKLTAATIGNSSTLRIGQQVVAIGNSLGQYQNTVTSGILSGKGRPVSAQDGNTVENLSDLLQTDAAINPGNSGGPLLNIAGQVIGINTAVAQDAQGIGFAIPINATKGEITNVLAGKGVTRSYLGLNYVTITPDVADQYNLSVKHGAYVYNSQSQSSVISGSPADKAGIKNKDIVLDVNGADVGSAGSLSSLVGEYRPGTSVKLTVLRNGKKMDVNVKLGTYTAPSMNQN